MNRKFWIAATLGGISLAMGSALLATSAWLLSMASLRPPILTLEVAVVSVRFFGLSRGIFRYLERLISHDAAFTRITKARVRLFESFLTVPYAKLKVFSRAEILQRLTKGIERREDLYLRVLVPWLSAVIAGVSGIGILSYLVPKLGLISGAMFLLLAALLPIIGYLNSTEFKNRQLQEEELGNKIVIAIEGRDESLLFNYSKQLQEQATSDADILRKLDFKEALLSGLSTAILTFFAGATSVVAIYFSYNEVENGLLSPVNLAVVVLLPLAIFDSLSTLPSAFAFLGEILKARDTLSSIELFSSEKFKTDSYDSILNVVDPFQLTLQDFQPQWNVDSASSPKISFVVQRGEIVLLTGPSGSGKSSVALAVMGLLDFEGSAKIDGIEIKNLVEEHRNLLLTLAPQNDYLFASSIRENLRIGDPTASDEKISKILSLVDLEKLIKSLPEGLDTHVGAKGLNFSGGEQRRLLLARALLRRTPFVILDEPFEFLDMEQVKRIAPRVFEYLKGRGVMVISHLPIPQATSVIALGMDSRSSG